MATQTPRGTWANLSATWRMGSPTLAHARPKRHLELESWQKT